MRKFTRKTNKGSKNETQNIDGKIDGRVLDEFIVKKGMRQGDLLYMVLFNIVQELWGKVAYCLSLLKMDNDKKKKTN